MTKPMITIHNVETDEIVIREMNDTEYEKYLADKAVTEANAAANAQKVIDRIALLAQLGITEQQAKLLLGDN